MSRTNVQKGRENAQRLREYIKSADSFPMYQGQLNKRKLVMSLGLGEAALQNEDIKQQLIDLSIKIAKSRKNKPHQSSINEGNSQTVAQLRKLVDALTRKLAMSEAQLDVYRRAEISHSHLIQTGKFIHQVTLPDSKQIVTFNTDDTE